MHRNHGDGPCGFAAVKTGSRRTADRKMRSLNNEEKETKSCVDDIDLFGAGRVWKFRAGREHYFADIRYYRNGGAAAILRRKQ